MQFNLLIDLFSSLPDWQARYRQLMMLGDQLPTFPIDAKNTDTLVSGCESKVWLQHNQIGHRHYFLLTSESRIIRGLLFILHTIIHGQKTEWIQDIDFKYYLRQLGLDRHLTDSRSNGLKIIMATIKAQVQ